MNDRTTIPALSRIHAASTHSWYRAEPQQGVHREQAVRDAVVGAAVLGDVRLRAPARPSAASGWRETRAPRGYAGRYRPHSCRWGTSSLCDREPTAGAPQYDYILIHQPHPGAPDAMLFPLDVCWGECAPRQKGAERAVGGGGAGSPGGSHGGPRAAPRTWPHSQQVRTAGRGTRRGHHTRLFVVLCVCHTYLCKSVCV